MKKIVNPKKAIKENQSFSEIVQLKISQKIQGLSKTDESFKTKLKHPKSGKGL